MHKKSEPLKADFHIHTCYSYDSKLKPRDIIKKANESGLDILGITDHGTTKGGKEIENIVKKTKQNLIIFVGQEVRTRQGEILVFNIDNDLPEKRDLIETCKNVTEKGGFIILPHPFDFMRRNVSKMIDKILKYTFAIEVFNSRCVFNYFNTKTMKFADKNKIPIISGSDAHFTEEVGNGLCLIKANKNKKDILRAIKNRQVKIVAKKTSMLIYIKHLFYK